MGVAIVKTVAERDHHARVVAGNDGGKPAQRCHGIVRRQQHAARGKAGTLFQMQVGNHEQTLLFPEQRAGEIGEQGDVGDDDALFPSPLRGGVRGGGSSE